MYKKKCDCIVRQYINEYFLLETKKKEQTRYILFSFAFTRTIASIAQHSNHHQNVHLYTNHPHEKNTRTMYKKSLRDSALHRA